MRKLPAFLVTAGLVVSLAACSAEPAFVDSCAPSGNAALVTALGSFGNDPRATFPTPLISTDVAVAELTTGDGIDIGATDAVEVSVSIYDGATGVPLASQSGDLIGVELRSFVTGDLSFTAAFTCATVGSRLVVTGTAEQLFGPESLGLDPEQTLIAVNDIVLAYPGQATGVEQLVPGGFPSVVFTPDGQPGFTFVGASPPSELVYAVMRQGSGAIVAEGDEIAANLTGIVWNGTATFASSFENLAPGPLLIQELAADGTGTVPGLVTALIGQKVGSRILVVVPPSDGYPPGAAPGTVGPEDTMVFVVDILAIR